MARRICAETEYPSPLPAVAGYGLPGARRPMPDEPLPDAAWAAVLAGARQNRITGLLDAAVVDGAFSATERQAEQVRTLHRASVVRVMAIERELLSVVALLGSAGIEARVLKGCAVAYLDYPDSARRTFVDLDVLVRAREVKGAESTLAAAGFVRTLAEPRPGFDQRFDKGMTLVPQAGYELDLHRTFVLGPWGVLIDLDRLWDEGQQFRIGGRSLTALSPVNRFLHACYHAALGDWPLRLGSLRDIAQMLPMATANEGQVRAVAAEWGAEAVVAAAVSDTVRLLGMPATGELVGWARSFVPSRRDEAWLALYTHPDKTFAALALATLRTLPRWRDRAAYARALLAPDGGYIAGRHGSWMGRLRYAVQEIRRGRGPDQASPSGQA